MRRFRIFITLFALFVAFFGVAITLQHRGLQNVRKNPPFVDTWKLSGRSGEILKLVSLRYDLVVADFLWLRAIQSFGGRGMTNRDWRPLYNMFDTVTTLDPYFEEVYTFGNLAIGDEGGQQREALKLLNKGMFKLVRKYRIPFEGMYVAHWQIGDLKLARWYGRIATKRVDAPDWVPRVTAYLDVQAGSYYIGFDRFLGNLLDGMDASEPSLMMIALDKMKETIYKWNVSLLTKALDEYTSSTGKLPEKVEDLAGMPALQNYEVASMSKALASVFTHAQRNSLPGIPRELLTNVALPTGVDLSKSAAETTAAVGNTKLKPLQNVIFQESLVTQSGIPEESFGTKFLLNRTILGNPLPPTDKTVIGNEINVQEFLKEVLNQVRTAISIRRQELGRLPKDLNELFYTDFNTTEPFGGKFVYDPESGDFKSTTYPNY